MLFPRFTLRWILVAITLFGCFSYFLAQAVRGHTWAIGVSTGLASVLVLLLIHAALFLIAYVLTDVTGLAQGRSRPESPFAASKPPPQLIQPRDPES